MTLLQQQIDDILNDRDNQELFEDEIVEHSSIRLPDEFCNGQNYILTEDVVSEMSENLEDGYALIENIEYEDKSGDYWNVFLTPEGLCGGSDEPEFDISSELIYNENKYVFCENEDIDFESNDQYMKLATDLRLLSVNMLNTPAPETEASIRSLIEDVEKLPPSVSKFICTFVTGSEFENKSDALLEMHKVYRNVLKE